MMREFFVFQMHKAVLRLLMSLQCWYVAMGIPQRIVLGLTILPIFVYVTTACAQRTGAALNAQRWRCEPARLI